MDGLDSTRWVAVSALGVAMFAVGFSFAAVACSTQREVSVTEAAHVMDKTAAGTAVGSGFAGASATGARSVDVPQAEVHANASAAPSASEVALKLKRLVVTHEIENREPRLGTDFALDSAPVYAFVELENTGSEARAIRILFQNEDTKATVGHVKLSVPGSQLRFRTWGNTRMIRDPGHWVAVVSTADGVELGRAPFDVKG